MYKAVKPFSDGNYNFKSSTKEEMLKINVSQKS